jgi:hypothetical protein
VDGTSLFLGNSLNVKTIKPVPSVSTEVHSIVPGITPKQYNSNNSNCTHKKWGNPIHFDNDNSKVQSIFAYPLTKEDQETGEVIESPPTKLPSKKHLTPTSRAVVDTISSLKLQILLKVLFDPGLTSTLISCKCLPRHCKHCAITNEHKIHMLAGTCSTKQMVVMRHVRLPELDKNAL